MKFSKVRKSKCPAQACIWTNSIALEQIMAINEIKSTAYQRQEAF